MFNKINKILLVSIVLVFIISAIGFGEEYQGTPPANFDQAPEYDELVEAGELPPVEDRLPVREDIYVVEPEEEIGTYGGTIRTASTVPEGPGGDTLLSIFPNPVKPSSDLSEIVPHIIKRLESSSDYKVWTMHLRKGMKWSDGEPFTTEDIMFWYEDMLHNEELTPIIGKPWNKLEEVEQVNEYEIEFHFPNPQPFFDNRLVHVGAWDFLMPKHFLKQFHPEYTDTEELNELVEENDFDEWYELFGHKNGNIWGTPIREGRPGLTPYIIERKTSDRRIFKRNPYYWKTDTEGNQLPYIERITCDILSGGLEVIQGKVMSGDLDFAGRNTDLQNYPMYRNYEEEGNYNTVLWDTTYGSALFFMVNMTHEDMDLRETFQKKDFRRALSLAIDRDEINQMVYFGQGTPRQLTVLPESKYFEEEFAEAYADYDPEKARELLDGIGLDQKNSQGFRMLPNGEPLQFTIEYPDVVLPRTTVTELVEEYWKEIGINVNSKVISGELQGQRAPANMLDASNWNGGRESDILFPMEANILGLVPDGTGWERTNWPLWETYYSTEGREGEEPPAQIKKIHDWWENVLNEPDEEKRMELSKKILRAQAENIWVIGTVGMIPHPLIVNKDLVNFPQEGYWGWDTATYSMSRDPSQIFFKK